MDTPQATPQPPPPPNVAPEPAVGSAPTSSPPPPQPASGPGTSRGAGVFIALLVVAAVLLLAAGVTLLGGRSSETSTATYPDITTLALDLDNADVQVVAGGEEAIVDQRVRTSRWGGEALADVSDGTLRLVLDCPSFNWLSFGRGCSGEYVVSVPADTEVTGGTGNGAIRVAGLAGQVNLATSNGAVEVSDTTGPVTVETSNGAITGSDLGSATFRAGTSNGPVRLAFTTPPDEVSADTSNGAIEVVVPRDAPAYDVRASTSNGRVSTAVQHDPEAPRVLMLTTSNGAVDIHYPR